MKKKTKNDFKRGDKIGEVTFLYRMEESLSRGMFKCYCGEPFITNINSVRVGKTRSCGCLRTKLLKERHGKKHPALTTKQVNAIREEIKLNDRPMRLIAERYGVGISKIAKIRTDYYANS